MFTFLISYPHVIAGVIWGLMAAILILRYFEVSIIKKISLGWFVAAALLLHILYDSLITIGQYIVWSHTKITSVFLTASLPEQVPLAWWMEWLRPWLEQVHGFFVFYAFNHFFLSTTILFLVVLILTLLLVLWSKLSPANFRKGDIAFVVTALLIAGWPKLILLLPSALVLLVACSFVRNRTFKEKHFHIPLPFLFTLPVILLFGEWLLKFFNLYTLLKI